MAEIERLRRVVALERELARRREADPLAHMRWLPGQMAFLASTAKRKLFRAGNQAQGKTTAGAAEVLFRADGRHPYKLVPPAPTYQWVVCATEQQSCIVQRKVWELCPKGWVADDCVYDHRKGALLGKYPTLRLRNGSWVGFRTGGGDPTNLASEKLHHALFDEPPESERVYNEVQKRVLRTNGDVSLTFTPVNRPTEYLREKCERGLVEDLHYDLRPEHLVFDDGERMTLDDGTPMDEAWIQGLIDETSDMEVPVLIHGGWEFRLEGAYFAKVWSPGRYVREAPPGEYHEHLGIDFGSRPGKQITLYVLVDPQGGSRGYPHIHIEDEYVGSTGAETNEDDAAATLAMLRRHKSSWGSLRGAMADRAHRSGRADQKSALDLSRAVAAEIGVEHRQLAPAVWVAKRGEGRGAGSVALRWRWLHGQMARGNVTVHPRCTRLLEALPKASPLADDEWKDPVDALVYGCDQYVYAARESAASVGVW